MPVHHFCAAQQLVAWEGGLRVELSRVGSLCADRLSGERRLVDAQRGGIEQGAVGWNLVASLHHDSVADDHIAFRYLAYVPVSDHLHGLFVVCLTEQTELAVGLILKDEGQRSGKKHCHEYADRFKKDA